MLRLATLLQALCTSEYYSNPCRTTLLPAAPPRPQQALLAKARQIDDNQRRQRSTYCTSLETITGLNKRTTDRVFAILHGSRNEQFVHDVIIIRKGGWSPQGGVLFEPGIIFVSNIIFPRVQYDYDPSIKGKADWEMRSLLKFLHPTRARITGSQTSFVHEIWDMFVHGHAIWDLFDVYGMYARKSDRYDRIAAYQEAAADVRSKAEDVSRGDLPSNAPRQLNHYNIATDTLNALHNIFNRISDTVVLERLANKAYGKTVDRRALHKAQTDFVKACLDYTLALQNETDIRQLLIT